MSRTKPSGQSSGNQELQEEPITFDYRKVVTPKCPNGEWRAYITKMPNLHGRSTSFHRTHRLSDGNEYYVCWSEPFTTKETCVEVSKIWAEKIQEYAHTGKEF